MASDPLLLYDQAPSDNNCYAKGGRIKSESCPPWFDRSPETMAVLIEPPVEVHGPQTGERVVNYVNRRYHCVFCAFVPEV